MAPEPAPAPAPADRRPLLYTYRRCPYAMRARMALLLAGHAFDAHEIVLRDKPAGLLTASPKGTVPVLVLPEGRVIDQSLDIMAWALTQPGAGPSASAWWDRAQTDDLLWLQHTNDGAFKHHLDRYKYPERFGLAGQTREQAVAGHREQALHAFVTHLEARLGQGPYLGGAQPCAADLGIFPFVRQFAAVDPAWFNAVPLPHVHAWLAHWVSSPLFAACMAQLPANEVQAFPRSDLIFP